MLNKLLYVIESKYSSLLENWNGDVSLFDSVKNVVNSIFSQVEWKATLKLD